MGTVKPNSFSTSSSFSESMYRESDFSFTEASSANTSHESLNDIEALTLEFSDLASFDQETMDKVNFYVFIG